MAYWYPKQVRVKQLENQLNSIESVLGDNPESVDDFLPYLSNCLRTACQLSGFPRYQIRQWVWIASQYRLHAKKSDETAKTAGAALNYLGQILESVDEISEDIRLDLNWVISATIAKLTFHLGPNARRSCLGPEEIDEIENKLNGYEDAPDTDFCDLQQRIRVQLSEIHKLSGEGYLEALSDKIDALFSAMQRNGDVDGPIAKSALLYLADKNDVVSDTAGFLGLVDDIYVIERAFSTVENLALWLPLLEVTLAKWPFIGDLSFGAGIENAVLDRYCKYAICAALTCLCVGELEPKKRLLIVREVGPLAILAAMAAAFETMSTDLKSASGSKFENQQPIILGEEMSPLRALYDRTEVINGEQKHWIIVAQSARLTVDEDVIACASPSPTEHINLDSGNVIQSWIKDRRPNALSYLARGPIQVCKPRTGILLVTQRKKIDRFLPHITPLGIPLPALTGMRYLASTGAQDDLRGSRTDAPTIYACSHPSAAMEILADPPLHIKTWQLIIDGSKAAQTLWGAISATPNLPIASVCVIGELSEREHANELIKVGFAEWFIQDTDIEAQPTHPFIGPSSDNPLKQFIERHRNHWLSSRTIHEIRDDFFETIADCHAGFRDVNNELNADVLLLAFNLSKFLRKAISVPLIQAGETLTDLSKLSFNIHSYASVSRAFDPNANTVWQLFGDVANSEISTPNREEKLREIIANSDQESTKEFAVVCQSSPIATQCRSLASGDALLSDVKWITLDELRQTAPRRRLIVPGWLGRSAMREIINTGYGIRTDFIFLPFEKKWFESMINAGLRWEDRLEKRNAFRHSELKAEYDDIFEAPEALRRTKPTAAPQTEPEYINPTDIVEPITETALDFGYLKERIIEVIRDQVPHSGAGVETAKAQLVLFERDGSYAFLPPNGTVVDLSGIEQEILETGDVSHNQPNEEKAEKYLSRKVNALQPGMLLAFPVETDRDLIDARADQFLEDADDVRRSAQLWKTALKNFFIRGLTSYEKFAEWMAEADERRDPSTIRSWTNNSLTVAPRNFRKVIPLIGNLTKDIELQSNLNSVLSAVDLIYRARTRAAAAIVREIFQGSIDLNAEELSINIGQAVICYELHRVSSIEDLREIPIDQIGKLKQLMASELQPAAE